MRLLILFPLLKLKKTNVYRTNIQKLYTYQIGAVSIAIKD